MIDYNGIVTLIFWKENLVHVLSLLKELSALYQSQNI